MSKGNVENCHILVFNLDKRVKIDFIRYFYIKIVIYGQHNFTIN